MAEYPAKVTPHPAPRAEQVRRLRQLRSEW